MASALRLSADAHVLKKVKPAVAFPSRSTGECAAGSAASYWISDTSVACAAYVQVGVVHTMSLALLAATARDAWASPPAAEKP